MRFDDVDHETKLCFVTVPSWNPDEIVRLARRSLPEEVWRAAEAGKRVFAQVNLGAEKRQELFFRDWELAS